MGYVAIFRIAAVVAFSIQLLGAQTKAPKKPCHPSLSTCPDSGCYKPQSPQGVENILKHRRPANDEDPTVLTLADFHQLQQQIDARFGKDSDCPKNYRSPSESDRKHCLSHLKLPGHSDSRGVSEQDYVEIVGYLSKSESKSGPPKANSSGESVNCNLTGAENNDFHINVVDSPAKTEYDGIVVEMIPQERNDEWTLSKLRDAQRSQLMVRVRGQLMLDNKHRVNGDQKHPIGGQPKRMSLWEIHPVTEFAVCTQKQCTGTSGWTELENWKGSSK